MLNRFIVIISLIFFSCNIQAQKITSDQKTLEQLKTLANENMQKHIRDMFKSKVKQPLLQLPIDDKLFIDIFQQTMTLQNQNDFMFVARRRNIDSYNNRFISQGLFYGVKGIYNIYTIGLIFKF